MDRILIKDLLARCVLGVTPEERREKQEIVINLALWTDIRVPARTDRLEDAMDYRSLKKKILKMTEESEYHLIEALAEAIAQLCLTTPSVHKVEVTVEKPTELRFTRGVAVEISRERAGQP
ncbi:dihydroneopterin aldolase [Sorangium sp. KYC3313]|uniref:dihydroneopterin aldolase n=1 Tax=Sorangium sp. KYC3313 TaxID=3449740 RepID=UPI003F8A2E81